MIEGGCPNRRRPRRAPDVCDRIVSAKQSDSEEGTEGRRPGEDRSCRKTNGQMALWSPREEGGAGAWQEGRSFDVVLGLCCHDWNPDESVVMSPRQRSGELLLDLTNVATTRRKDGSKWSLSAAGRSRRTDTQNGISTLARKSS